MEEVVYPGEHTGYHRQGLSFESPVQVSVCLFLPFLSFSTSISMKMLPGALSLTYSPRNNAGDKKKLHSINISFKNNQNKSWLPGTEVSKSQSH